MAEKTPNSAKKKRTETTTDISTASTTQSLLSYGVKPYALIPGEEYMGTNQTKHFRNLLNIWKAALMEGGDETIHDLKEMAEVPADISDQATLEETFALKLRTRDREYKLINKIDEAIKRIDNKTYGYCEECGIDIGLRRLEALPTATLCIDCKTLAEVKERQGR